MIQIDRNAVYQLIRHRSKFPSEESVMKLEDFLEELGKSAAARSRTVIDDDFQTEIDDLIRKNLSVFSIDKLNAEIERRSDSYNDRPVYEFTGLSPNEMRWLLDFPLSEKSPVRLKTPLSDDILDRIGFFRLAEEFLTILKRDGSIKLTNAGYLPPKIVLELHSFHFVAEWAIDEGILKLRREEDSVVIRTLHHVVLMTPLARKIHGKLVLTKEGKQAMDRNEREKIFNHVFHAYTEKFNWAYNDAYPDFPLCTDAYGYTLYLLSKFGDIERPKDFYAEVFLKAFPMSIDEFVDSTYVSARDSFIHCYTVRTFSRFLEWFNFVDVVTADKSSNRPTSNKRSDLFEAVFDIL
jgi:hypothetical protein